MHGRDGPPLGRPEQTPAPTQGSFPNPLGTGTFVTFSNMLLPCYSNAFKGLAAKGLTAGDKAILEMISGGAAASSGPPV